MFQNKKVQLKNYLRLKNIFHFCFIVRSKLSFQCQGVYNNVWLIVYNFRTKNFFQERLFILLFGFYFWFFQISEILFYCFFKKCSRLEKRKSLESIADVVVQLLYLKENV